MIESGNDPVLIAVGDVAPLYPPDPASPGSSEVWDHLRSADLSTANLEIPLSTGGSSADKAITLRAGPEVAPSLRDLGIGLVTVANNHALDYGADGLYDTLSALRDADVVAVGGGRNLEEATQPALVSVGEASVAVFGLASTLPPGFAAGPGRPGIAPVRARSRFYVDAVSLDEQPGMSPWVETEAVEEDVRQTCQRIRSDREQTDLVVIHIHWGIPNGWCAAFQGPLADYQRPLGRALIDAGADLVVGHHPHVVHGVERYKGGLIAYSLGHFLFHSMSEDRETELTNSYPPYDLSSLETGAGRQTVILELKVARNRMTSVSFRPVRMNARGEPEFARGAEGEGVLGRLAEHSSRMGTKVEVRSHEVRVAL
jgi:poly-gamma-glutamate capsule biosynthesis protein CapA/YwtB (metallophosphatase superfamily)